MNINIGPRFYLQSGKLELISPDISNVLKLAEKLREQPLYNVGDLSGMGEWSVEIDPDKRYISFLQNSLKETYVTPSVNDWSLRFVLKVDEELVGVQGVFGVNNRVFNSGSWIFPEFRGRGFGSKARNIVYQAMFGLGFVEGYSETFEFNEVSSEINKKQGAELIYQQNREAWVCGVDSIGQISNFWRVSKDSLVKLHDIDMMDVSELNDLFSKWGESSSFCC